MSSTPGSPDQGSEDPGALVDLEHRAGAQDTSASADATGDGGRSEDSAALVDAESIGGPSPDMDALAGAVAARRAVEVVDAEQVARAREAGEEGPAAPPARAGMARNTAIFSVATGLSRIAGLAREIVAASYFGTSGPASAFTIAFQVPNLVRGLFADAALSAAFVPIFAEYLEQRRRREAILLASTLFWIILLVLGALTALFIVGAGVIMPIFIPGDQFTQQLVDLTVGLSQVLFPVVVLLGINGLLVGIANSYHHFTIPALAPLVWNIVIIGGLIVLRPLFTGDDQIYAYAIGVLIGTIVQLLMVVPVLARIDFRLKLHLDWRNPDVVRVFRLMLPVTIGLGVINIDLLINSVVGALISESAPRAIDAAFRIYMLPQGVFSVALATVLFPSLSRLVARHDTDGLRALVGTGTRQNLLLLIPAAVATMVLAKPIVQLIYQYGAFGSSSTDEVATALLWFSFSLPFAGLNLLLTRTFFSLQRPWIPTALAAANLVVNLALSLLLYKPFGIAGPVIGTAVASAGMTFSQVRYLRPQLDGSLQGHETLRATGKILLASALLAVVLYGVWWPVDRAVGDATATARLLAVSLALAAGAAAYVAAIRFLRVPEAEQIGAFLHRWRRRAA
ncbi:MAG TPA: murein biosynthesis integral membrane protein MurJ [Solirubrobacteraceae bacterium]|nr:murein biosynthesis integral membrane protein MurJ [Solirubrobacteraceae bacterium]